MEDHGLLGALISQPDCAAVRHQPHPTVHLSGDYISAGYTQRDSGSQLAAVVPAHAETHPPRGRLALGRKLTHLRGLRRSLGHLPRLDDETIGRGSNVIERVTG